MIIENPVRTKQLIQDLVQVWEESVKETHLFLEEKNVTDLKPFVEEGLKEITYLIVVYKERKPIGFMGIEKEKIEMLFLKPDYMGRGLGKRLIEKAIQEYNVTYVDVNEQNSHALAFYKHVGFQVYERTEIDEQGNPFPILKLKR